MKTVLFRTDGGTVADIGTGHIHRSLLVADYLRDSYKVIFSSLNLPTYEYGHSMISNKGYPLYRLSAFGYHDELARLVDEISPDFIICDKYEYDEEELKIFKRKEAPLMTYDHFESHRKYSDYPINAIIEESDNPYSGLDFVIMPPSQTKCFRTTPENIFVCFGGFDYLDITLKLMNIFMKAEISIPVNVVVGSGYPYMKTLSQYADSSGQTITIYQEPLNFQELLADADIAFVAGGLVFYQILSLGIAPIVVCQYDHQLEQVRNLAAHHACILLGMGNMLDRQAVVSTLQTLTSDVKIRHDIYERGRTLVDGNGLGRVVNIIRGCLAK